MRANFSSSPRKLPSYEPREKTHDEIAEIRPTVSNFWVIRVPSPSGSKVALDRPRRIQLPNLVAKRRGRIDLEDLGRALHRAEVDDVRGAGLVDRSGHVADAGHPADPFAHALEVRP